MKAILSISLSLLIGVLSGVHPVLGQELVGLQNVTLKPGELLWTFDIHLQEGRIVALCNVPEGWTITAENYGEAALYKEGGGRAHGSADFGHDALPATELSQLGGLLLIDRSEIHRKSAILTGFVTISGLSDNRKVKLRPENFARREAGQCPLPPVENHLLKR
ncbi:exported hypothetical protein [Candidatus Sulfotelmatobacter sp. SbA7]|nr:exported hypothetical protein [Candidatus Sulfotelmatobacter sp. SbA7]